MSIGHDIAGNVRIENGVFTIDENTTLAANRTIVAASGTGLLDFSSATGIFKTSSGANTLSGSTTINGNLTPDTNASRLLGSSSNRWNGLYNTADLAGGYRSAASPVTATHADFVIAVTGTGIRTVNLPAANTLQSGQLLLIKEVGNDAGTITINRAGSDVFDNSDTTITISTIFGAQYLISDGSSKWLTFNGTGGGTSLSNIAGDITFLKETDHNISVVSSTTAATVGGALSINTGDGQQGGTTTAGGFGGLLTMFAGAGASGGTTSGNSGNGGTVNVTAGAAADGRSGGSGNAGFGGSVHITSGLGGTSNGTGTASAGGQITLTGSSGGAASGSIAGAIGGPIFIISGNGGSGSSGASGGGGGGLQIVAGNGGTAVSSGNAGNGGTLSVTAGRGGTGTATAASGFGGNLIIRAGSAGAAGGGTGNGGSDVSLIGGDATGTGNNKAGDVIISSSGVATGSGSNTTFVVQTKTNLQDDVTVSAGKTITTPKLMSTQAGTVQFNVTFSTTPAFDAINGAMQRIALTNSITSWTIANGTLSGQIVRIYWIQDATGTRTLSGTPGNVKLSGGVFTLTLTGNKRDMLELQWDSSDNIWYQSGFSLNL